jgi:hypothetical protein
MSHDNRLVDAMLLGLAFAAAGVAVHDLSAVPSSSSPTTRGVSGKHLTKQITVTDSANVRLQRASGQSPDGIRCQNTTTAPVYIVESDASDTTNGDGPYCTTCGGGPFITSPSREVYARTSSGTATLQCGFVDGGASFGGAGGGVSLGLADDRYALKTGDTMSGPLVVDSADADPDAWSLTTDNGVIDNYGAIEAHNTDSANVAHVGTYTYEVPAQPTPSLWLKLDEGSGTTLNDSSSHAYNVTLTASTWAWTSSPTAIHFPVGASADSNWMQLSTLCGHGDNKFSVCSLSALVKFDTTATNRNGSVNGGNSNGYNAILTADSGAGLFTGNIANGGTNYLFALGGSVAPVSTSNVAKVDLATLGTTAEHLVTMTYDGTSTKLYIDAVLVDTKATPNAESDNRPIRLAAANNAGAAGMTIRHAEVFASTLSAAQVQQLYDSLEGNPTSLISENSVGAYGSTDGGTLAGISVAGSAIRFLTSAAADALDYVQVASGHFYYLAVNTAVALKVDAAGDMLGTQATGGTMSTWRVPTGIATTMPTKPTCSTSANAGQLIYVDDSDDANSGELCVCRANSAGTYAWVKVQDNSTACPS